MFTRRSLVLSAAAVVMSALVVAGCVEPPPTAPTPNPAGLQATLTATAIELAWTPTADGQANGYDLQVLPDGGTWTALPSGTDAAFSFTDVTPRTRYNFRVRSRVAPGATPNEWSPKVISWFVVPALPIVRIETVDRQPIVDKENYVAGSMTIDPNGSGFDAYSGTLRMRGRGNSTWGYPKKPYKLKLDAKASVMGIAANKDWVLLANWVDRSQMRNWTAGEISRATDLQWTPTFRHVEVILNGEYQGVYNLTEQVEVKDDRVEIEEMEPTDIAGNEVTGGYLLEIDDRLEENDEPGFRTSKNVPVVVKDPDPMAPEQRNYIRKHVQTFEDRLMGQDFTDPVLGYRPYLDVNAFIDLWTVQELARNGDSYWSSTYFTKERGDDRLRFGPMWDFDRSMGSPVTFRPQPPEGWYARDRGAWTKRLFQDPAFATEVRTRWEQLSPVFSTLPAQLDAVAATIEPAMPNDEARWSYTRGPQDQSAFLSDWLQTRIDWMSAAFDAEA